jgi:hypothetical protein
VTEKEATSNATVLGAVQELRQYADKKNEPEIVEARTALWKTIISELKIGREELEGRIAETVNCQPITIRRWIEGKYSPRPVALDALVKLLTTIVLGTAPELELVPDPLVSFHHHLVAIRRIEHFFYCLQYAKIGIHLRGRYGYRAKPYPGARSRLLGLLKRSGSDLQMHYILEPTSPADKSVRSFLQLLQTNETTIAPRVFLWHTEEKDGVNDILAYGVTSSFVVIYNTDGASKFGKLLDVWHEMPVATAPDPSGGVTTDVDEDHVEHLLLEMPASDAAEWWFRSRNLFLGRVVPAPENSYSREQLGGADGIQNLANRLVLENEYKGPGSPYLEFRKLFEDGGSPPDRQ